MELQYLSVLNKKTNPCAFVHHAVLSDGFLSPSAIVVVQSATVLDLKKAVRRYVELKQQREGGIKHVSWSVSHVLTAFGSHFL